MWDDLCRKRSPLLSAKMEKGKLPFGVPPVTLESGETGICLACSVQLHFRIQVKCCSMSQSKPARENLCWMGLGWSLFYFSTCWADTLWTVLFQVLMLKDVVIWVILLSLFSDFVLCILLSSL